MMIGRLREGPVSWAQSNLLQRHVRQMTQQRGEIWLRLVVEVPFRVDVAEIELALQAVIQRHEALRSTFEVDRQGRGRQVVWAPTSRRITFSLPPGEVPEGSVIGAAAPYDPAEDWPVRYALDVSEDGNFRIIITAAHAATDYYGLQVLGNDILHALREPAAAAVGNPAELQPVDIAEYERSPRGRAANNRAIKHWLDHLDEYAICQERLWQQQAGVGACQLSATVTLEGLQKRVARLAVDNRTPASAVVVAAISSAFSMLMNWQVPYFDLVVANRHLPRSDTAVCTLAQRSLLVVPESDSKDLSAYSKDCLPSILRAARNAHYNSNDLRAAIETRGGTADLLRRRPVTINVIQSDRNLAAPRLVENANIAVGTRPIGVLEAEIRESVLQPYLHILCILHPNAVRFGLHANPAIMAADKARHLISLICASIEK